MPERLAFFRGWHQKFVEMLKDTGRFRINKDQPVDEVWGRFLAKFRFNYDEIPWAFLEGCKYTYDEKVWITHLNHCHALPMLTPSCVCAVTGG